MLALLSLCQHTVKRPFREGRVYFSLSLRGSQSIIAGMAEGNGGHWWQEHAVAASSHGGGLRSGRGLGVGWA